MSHDERHGDPQRTYRAPVAAVLGKVEELTAGHAYNYRDGTGNHQQDKSRVEAPPRDEA